MNAIIISALWGVLMMYMGFVTNKTRMQGTVAILGLAFLLCAIWIEYIGMPLFSIDTKKMLSFSSFSLVFDLVIVFATLVYFLLSGEEIAAFKKNTTDFYALIFFILSGIFIISGMQSLLMLFIGIEIISIPLYVLAGSEKSNLKSNEAALKYFLLGSFSTGLMLMGIAFIYGDTGSFFLENIGMGLGAMTPMMISGLVLLIASMSFKVSAVPFHFWTPDVYDGTPTVFTSFMATIVKSAGFFAFFKLFENAFGNMHNQWQLLMSVIAVLTLLIGNITAVFQQSVKRLLSYSSIAQAGFMLLGVYALNIFAKQGLMIYFLVYSLATIGVFAVLAKFKDHSIEAFNGFAKKHPLVAFSVLISLFSLAGIPLTGGFFAKYYMLLAVIKYSNVVWLAIVAVLCAAISVYYYFRIVQAMYFKEPTENESIEFGSKFKYLLLSNAIFIILLGVHPDWLLALINN